MTRAFLIRARWDPLTRARDINYNRVLFPLSLAYCSSLLKKEGITTLVYDFHGMRTLDIEEELSQIKPDDTIFVTSSDIDSWLCPNLDLNPFLSIVSIVKQRTDKVFLMGPHGTMEPYGLLRSTGARAVIRGEPESKVTKLALGEDLRSVPGITYAIGEQVIHNPDCEDIILDKLPFPDFSLLKNADYHYELMGDRHVIIESTRNCPFRCNFCYKGMYGKSYRLKSVRRVIEEIRTAMRSGARRGTFIDLNIGINKSHLVNLCRVIRENVPHFEWCCQTTMESLDEELIPLMAQAGCKVLQFGIESADQKWIGRLGKKVDLERMKQVISICKRQGIQTFGSIIMGFPKESLEDAQRTLELGLKLSPTYLSILLLISFKGTPIYNADVGLDQAAYLEPCQKKRKHLEKMRLKTYLRHYLRPSSVREQLVLNRLPSVFSRAKFFFNYICKNLPGSASQQENIRR